MNPTFIVYVALCVPRNKLYFGLTSASLSTRIRKHLWEAGYKPRFRFHRALRKHGAEGFVWFEVCRPSTWEDGCEIERGLIRYFNTRDPSKGYNDTDGGEGRFGNKASHETRQKMSQSQKGRVISEVHRQKLREAWKHRAPASEETKLRMSEAHKGKPMNFSPEALERIGAANRGKKRSHVDQKEI